MGKGGGHHHGPLTALSVTPIERQGQRTAGTRASGVELAENNGIYLDGLSKVTVLRRP